MTKEEAKQLLKYHSFMDEDIKHPKMTRGFLGMLRPFSGELIEENYHEIIKAMKVLADDLRDKDLIDREIISCLWGICHLTRSWAIEKEGMLQSNNLITERQVELLEDWIEAISFAMMMILGGCDNEEAFLVC